MLNANFLLFRVSPREKIEGKFTVEESLLRNLKVMSITKDKEDIETFELISPSGKLHRNIFIIHKPRPPSLILPLGLSRTFFGYSKTPQSSRQYLLF